MRRKASRWTPSRSRVSTAGSSRSGRPESPPTSRPVGTCTITTRCGGSRSPDTGRRRTRDQGGLVTGPTRHESSRVPRLVPCCSTQEPVPDRIACGATHLLRQTNRTKLEPKSKRGSVSSPRSTDTRPEVAAAIRTDVVVPLLTHLSSVVEPLSWRVRVRTSRRAGRGVVDLGVVPGELDGAG